MNESPSAKNSDLVPTTTSDDEPCSSLSQSWSRYDCIFCKRGFTNAQALGGHMNIHRKQKAKLKQSNSITESRPQHLLENTTPPPTPAHSLVPPTISTSPERRAAVADNWTWNYHLEKNDTTSTTRSDECFVQEAGQLPSFNKTTLKVDDQDQKRSQKELSWSFSHGAELDLELRLGQESASDSSSPAKGT